MFVRLDEKETVSLVATSNVNCLPGWVQWVVYPDTTIDGVQWNVKAATTRQQCLDACVANWSCVAVEWSDVYGCWIDDLRRKRSQIDGVTTFEITRQCHSSSSGN